MDFYRQVLRLDMANFTEAGRGDLMNRCTSDLNSVGQGVQRLFGQALLEPLKVIVCLAIAAWVSWQLLLLTIIIAPLAGYAIHWLGKALKRTHRKAMQELSSIYETLSRNARRHQADQGLHDGSGRAEQVPPIVARSTTAGR